MTQIKAMSISSEKIHKRRASVVRTNLLRALLQKYVRKMYGDVVTDRAKLNDRQLIRHEYYNDIFECILNNCQLTKSSSELSSFGHCVLPMTRKERHGSRNASKKGKCIANKLDDVDMNPRCSMTVTRSIDNNIADNEEIGWGTKSEVELTRESGQSFGVCIVGGTVNISSDATQITGIFIKNIIPSSPAELCKKLQIGDRILSVNGQDVRHASQEYAINLMKNAGNVIKLEIQSFDLSDISKRTNMNRDSNREKETAPNVEEKTESKTAISDDEDGQSENDSEEEESLGKVLSRKGKEIDRKSAGNVKRSKDEARLDPEEENEFGYTDKKIKKRYGHLAGNVVRIKVTRTNVSLGIALAGHKNRNEMGCFIAGINPKGSMSSQDFKVGDEILEINGVVLHKMCHLNASVLIKRIAGSTLEFILLRKDSSAVDVAVKAVTNFPVAIDQFDQLHSCYKNVRTVAIQKVGPSLGIMIIEGKHSELGQGIFISDIQEGSNAEMAGLLIGELILAVNKDLLIDCNYDTAASHLKRAEGLVTLIVCNPNKKEEKSTADEKSKSTKSDKKVTIEEPGSKAEKAEKPAEAEAPTDPAHATVKANKETVIEMNVNNKGLGLFMIGGKMLQPPVEGAFIVHICAGGGAEHDKRLQVFDKITELEGKKITSEMTQEDIRRVFKRRYLVAKMTVHRSDPPPTAEIDIDITRKAGKETGFNFIEYKNYGILVTEIVPGTATALDNRLMIGDIITSINGENVKSASFVDCVLLMKCSPTRVVLKVLRPDPKK